MTLYEFNGLDEMEQAEAVWEGVFYLMYNCNLIFPSET